MDTAAAIGASHLARDVGSLRDILVGIRPIERRVSGRSCSAATPPDIWGDSGAVYLLVWPVSGDEVSSGVPGEVSPVAGAEPLDESPAAAAWAGDVCLAGCGADRRRHGAGIDALWQCAPRAVHGFCDGVRRG